MRPLTFLVLLAACQATSPHLDPLTDAARSGDAARVTQLIRAGANPNTPTGGNEWPPLLHAVHKHQLKSVEALVAAGADVNRPSPSGTTPLMMAAGYGQNDTVTLLLRLGADTKRKDLRGASALDYALTGMSDIDGFTLFTCQMTTAKLLEGAPVKRLSTQWANWKRCA